MSVIKAIETHLGLSNFLSKYDKIKGDTTKMKLDLLDKLNKLIINRPDYDKFHAFIYNTLTNPTVKHALNDNSLSDFDIINLDDADKYLLPSTKKIIIDYLGSLC
jgi:hypothetical protein